MIYLQELQTTKIDATNSNSANQTQQTNVNSHKLSASGLTGIFTTINERQALDKEVSFFDTSLTSLHQKFARNQIKKLNRFNMNLKKEKNQRPLKCKYDELLNEFNALKQETAQIFQHIGGNEGNHQED